MFHNINLLSVISFFPFLSLKKNIYFIILILQEYLSGDQENLEGFFKKSQEERAPPLPQGSPVMSYAGISPPPPVTLLRPSPVVSSFDPHFSSPLYLTPGPCAEVRTFFPSSSSIEFPFLI